EFPVCARVHQPRRRHRRTDVDLRLRLRRSDGCSARRAHRPLSRHPARAHHLRDVRAGVVDADRAGRPRRAVLQRHHQVRRERDAHRSDLAELSGDRLLRRRQDPNPEGGGRRRHLCQRQRHVGARVAGRRAGRRVAPVRLPTDPRVWSATVRGGRCGQADVVVGRRVLRQRCAVPVLPTSGV
ncbi:MAG: Dihydrofolate reductase, partial [uncultured Nocardioidaceae bacterium]